MVVYKGYYIYVEFKKYDHAQKKSHGWCIAVINPHLNTSGLLSVTGTVYVHWALVRLQSAGFHSACVNFVT